LQTRKNRPQINNKRSPPYFKRNANQNPDNSSPIFPPPPPNGQPLAATPKEPRLRRVSPGPPKQKNVVPQAVPPLPFRKKSQAPPRLFCPFPFLFSLFSPLPLLFPPSGRRVNPAVFFVFFWTFRNAGRQRVWVIFRGFFRSSLFSQKPTPRSPYSVPLETLAENCSVPRREVFPHFPSPSERPLCPHAPWVLFQKRPVPPQPPCKTYGSQSLKTEPRAPPLPAKHR